MLASLIYETNKNGLFVIQCILVDSSTVIYQTSLLVISAGAGVGCKVYFVAVILFLVENPVANNVDPHYVASDLSLHCLQMIILRVSR